MFALGRDGGDARVWWLVARQKAQGYDFLKPYARLSRAAYEALAAAGKQHGLVLAGHVPDAVGLAGVLAAGQKSIEHLDGWLFALVPADVTVPSTGGVHARLRGALPRLDAAKLPGLIAQTIAAGTWNCPSLIGYERLGALEHRAALAQRMQWLALVPPRDRRAMGSHAGRPDPNVHRGRLRDDPRGEPVACPGARSAVGGERADHRGHRHRRRLRHRGRIDA